MGEGCCFSPENKTFKSKNSSKKKKNEQGQRLNI